MKSLNKKEFRFSEGKLLLKIDTNKSKAMVANRIRDPGSHSRKRCKLDFYNYFGNLFKSTANALNLPPVYYERKLKIQSIRLLKFLVLDNDI